MRRVCGGSRGEIKQHTLDHLDYYLQQLEANVKANGGQVHFAAESAQDANRIVVGDVHAGGG